MEEKQLKYPPPTLRNLILKVDALVSGPKKGHETTPGTAQEETVAVQGTDSQSSLGAQDQAASQGRWEVCIFIPCHTIKTVSQILGLIIPSGCTN